MMGQTTKTDSYGHILPEPKIMETALADIKAIKGEIYKQSETRIHFCVGNAIVHYNPYTMFWKVQAQATYEGREFNKLLKKLREL